MLHCDEDVVVYIKQYMNTHAACRQCYTERRLAPRLTTYPCFYAYTACTACDYVTITITVTAAVIMILITVTPIIIA